MGFIQDYMTYVCVVTFIAVIRFVFFHFTTTKKLDSFGGPKVEYEKPKDQNIVEKVEKLYKMDIKYVQERSVPIKSIWMYPVRGIKGFKV